MHRSREYECFRYRPNLNNSIKMHSAIGSLRSWMCTETPQPAIFIFFALRLTHLCSCVRRATERNEFVWSRNSSSWLRFQANHFCFLNFSCFSLHFLSFFHFVCCEQWAQCKYAESRQLFSVPCSYSMKKKKNQHVQRATDFVLGLHESLIFGYLLKRKWLLCVRCYLCRIVDIVRFSANIFISRKNVPYNPLWIVKNFSLSRSELSYLWQSRILTTFTQQM